nr:4Fe-4S binding protein [Desulfovibrio inopinatus]
MFMTKNILRNISKKSATRLYPFEVREPFENYRGELINDIDSCIFCGMCSRVCPSQCITVDRKTGEWTCDPFACVYCGICVDACPPKCLSQKSVHRTSSPVRLMMEMQGTPPKPKKKKAAE